MQAKDGGLDSGGRVPAVHGRHPFGDPVEARVVQQPPLTVGADPHRHQAAAALELGPLVLEDLPAVVVHSGQGNLLAIRGQRHQGGRVWGWLRV